MRNKYIGRWTKVSSKNFLKIFLQVEMNIGPIGGPGCASQVSKLHAKLLDKLEAIHGETSPVMDHAQLPDQNVRKNMARTLYKAWCVVVATLFIRFYA